MTTKHLWPMAFVVTIYMFLCGCGAGEDPYKPIIPNGTYVGTFSPGVYNNTPDQTESFTANYVMTIESSSQYTFIESNSVTPFVGRFGNWGTPYCFTSLKGAKLTTNGWSQKADVTSIYFANCAVKKTNNITTFTAMYYFTTSAGTRYPSDGSFAGSITMTTAP